MEVWVPVSARGVDFRGSQSSRSRGERLHRLPSPICSLASLNCLQVHPTRLVEDLPPTRHGIMFMFDLFIFSTHGFVLVGREVQGDPAVAVRRNLPHLVYRPKSIGEAIDEVECAADRLLFGLALRPLLIV